MTRDDAEAMHAARDAPWFGVDAALASASLARAAAWAEQTPPTVDRWCALPSEAVRQLRCLAGLTDVAGDAPYCETAKALLAEFGAEQTTWALRYNVDNFLSSLPPALPKLEKQEQHGHGPLVVVLERGKARVTCGDVTAECNAHYSMRHEAFQDNHYVNSFRPEPARLEVQLVMHRGDVLDVASVRRLRSWRRRCGR